MPNMQKLSLFLILIILFGCNESFTTKPFFSMGTLVEITVSEKDKTEIENIKSEIERLSEFVKEETNKINVAGKNEKVVVDKRFIALLKKGGYFHDISQGRFDITIHTIMKLYGFPEGPYKVPSRSTLDQFSSYIGFENLIINENFVIKKSDFTIDMGAYAKGWIVDEAINFMKSRSIKNGIVNAGGDLYCLGDKNGDGWKIGIQHPDDKEKVISVLKLVNKAVVTSGDYERFFIENGKKYIHIFDAKKKETADNYKSISVIADSVEMADGLSTVYFLLNPQEIRSLCDKLKTPVLIYHLNGNIEKLCGWEKFEVN